MKQHTSFTISQELSGYAVGLGEGYCKSISGFGRLVCDWPDAPTYAWQDGYFAGFAQAAAERRQEPFLVQQGELLAEFGRSPSTASTFTYTYLARSLDLQHEVLGVSASEVLVVLFDAMAQPPDEEVVKEIAEEEVKDAEPTLEELFRQIADRLKRMATI